MQIDGEKIRRARERQVLSLRELAEKSGVTYVTLWRIETGATGPARPATIRKIAAGLGVPPESLIVWGESDNEPGEDTAPDMGKAAA